LGGQEAAVVGLGFLAVLLGAWGIVAAIRTRRRRAEIAPTYGSTGGIVYTAVQLGCSGAMLFGGLILITFVLLAKR
jgi:CHASE2 domain-containing sensor protein